MKSPFIFILCIAILCSMSCSDFLEVDPPRTELARAVVFASDATATAAVVDLYYQMSQAGFASGNIASISFFGALSSDEAVNYFTSSATVTQEYKQVSENTLLPNNSLILNLWSQLYLCIYKANAAMEGIEESSTITPALGNQLRGECLFVRSLCHFYLVNLFGDVPVVTRSDYRVNSTLPRLPMSDVYSFIAGDLTEAKNLLRADYSGSAGERIRANRGAASALLARTFLFMGDFSNAAQEATLVINNPSYSLVALGSVFLKNSNEAIFQLARTNQNTQDAATFFVGGTKPLYCALTGNLIASFEPGDARVASWIGSKSDGTTTYRFATKYKAIAATPVLEYSTVLRLAEAYLIRAEARAALGDLNGALEDLNRIRSRASLAPSSTNGKASLIHEIIAERRHELFTEWGHRWIDLKRVATVDAALAGIKPNWKSSCALYPIPEYEMLNNPSFHGLQNPGY